MLILSIIFNLYKIIDNDKKNYIDNLYTLIYGHVNIFFNHCFNEAVNATINKQHQSHYKHEQINKLMMEIQTQHQNNKNITNNKLKCLNNTIYHRCSKQIYNNIIFLYNDQNKTSNIQIDFLNKIKAAQKLLLQYDKLKNQSKLDDIQKNIKPIEKAFIQYSNLSKIYILLYMHQYSVLRTSLGQDQMFLSCLQPRSINCIQISLMKGFILYLFKKYDIDNLFQKLESDLKNIGTIDKIETIHDKWIRNIGFFFSDEFLSDQMIRDAHNEYNQLTSDKPMTKHNNRFTFTYIKAYKNAIRGFITL